MKRWKKVLFVLLPFSFLGIVLYLMFHENYKTIAEQLSRTKTALLLLMICFGLAYEFLDAAVMGKLVFPKVPNMTFGEMVQLTFLGVCMNITTYGTGIKPAQTFCLSKKGQNPGKAFAILTLPYVFHKATVVIYASVMLLLQNRFLKQSFGDVFHYLLAGYLVSFLVIAGLILLCTSKRLCSFICRLMERLIKQEKWQEKKNKIAESLVNLQTESEEIVKNYRIWFEMIIMNILKLSCWYILPLIGVYAVGGSMESVTVIQIIATAAFMQLIIGVIPTAGGMVSTEVVYTLLFGRLFGSATAGATMILFRLATYYLPFLISIPVVFTMKMYKKAK